MGTHNLVSNSFMNVLNENRDCPLGYTVSYFMQAGSQIYIKAVSPYSKGFEGPYKESRTTQHAASCDEATGDRPYFFGRYDKGPRARRGGLADGWGGHADGHILKIWGHRNGPDRRTQCMVKLPL